MAEINYSIILIAAFIAVISPGPASLAIATTSMKQGRLHGLILATGIATGGTFWSITAAYGFSVVIYANILLFEVMRYLGACYLLFLAYKMARSATSKTNTAIRDIRAEKLTSIYYKGLLLQLTNPKVILFFGSIYTVAIPFGTNAFGIASVIFAVCVQSVTLFYVLALLFSTTRFREFYMRLRRFFEVVFTAYFAFIGVKLLTTKFSGS